MKSETAATTERLASLDVLRGIDMFFILGFAPLVTAFCVAVGWGNNCALARQMSHVPWDGLVQHDTIFPLFLFIAGVAWPFSCAKALAKGQTRAQISFRCLRRAFLLGVLGIIYGGFLRDFAPPRVSSVLLRIGLAWCGAAILNLYFGKRVRILICTFLLLGYWALMVGIGAPDHPEAGHLTVAGNLSGWIDRTYLPGRIQGPDGLMDNQSTLGVFPAIVTAMLGVFTGEFIREAKISGGKRVAVLMAGGIALIVLGLFVAYGCGSFSMPINKRLWSSSFTLVVGGLSIVAFSIVYALVDVWAVWKRTSFFRVIGLNSIVAYMAPIFIPFSSISKNMFGGTASMLPGTWGEVMLKTGTLSLAWAFLWALHHYRIYLKV